MIWEHLQRVQQELKQGSRETQDTAIAALHDTLDTCSSFLFPSFAYPLLTELLHFYCQKVLPDMGIPAEDQRIVRAEFEDTIAHLNAQEQTATHREAQFKQFFLQVKSGILDTIEDIVTVLCEIAAAIPPLRDTPLQFPPRGGTGGCSSPPGSAGLLPAIPLLGGARGGFPPFRKGGSGEILSLQKSYRAFKKSPFTAAHVIPFFEALIAQLPPEIKTLFGYMATLFWNQLHEFIQIKAVLVNTKTTEALITRFDVTTSLESKGLDELIFENAVDDRMYHSCWKALQAARAFLEDQFSDLLDDKVLRITCCFPNPIAGYHDTSASLLVCLKVIGDVLDLAINPQTVISGEVDESGKALPVACVAEKVLAAQQHPEIHRVLLPAEGLFMTSRRVEITEVRNLSEAVASYYGEQFQKKLKQLSRRKVLKGALALAAVPFAPVVFSAFRNIFNHPVTEHDLRLFACAEELYQKKSDYDSAIIIFQSILDRFRGECALTEVIHLKAQVLSHLGRIYIQQCQLGEGLQAYRQASDLWQTIHHREHQIDMLLYTGIAYSDTVTEPEKYGQRILNYYQQAAHLLKPSMPTLKRLQGNIALWTGVLYHRSHQNITARKYVEQGMAYFQDADARWNYQLSKHHLGNILVELGE